MKGGAGWLRVQTGCAFPAGVVSLWSPSVGQPLVSMLCHRGPLTALAMDTQVRPSATHHLTLRALSARLLLTWRAGLPVPHACWCALSSGPVHGDGRHGRGGAGVGPAHLQEAPLLPVHHAGKHPPLRQGGGWARGEAREQSKPCSCWVLERRPEAPVYAPFPPLACLLTSYCGPRVPRASCSLPPLLFSRAAWTSASATCWAWASAATCTSGRTRSPTR